MHRKVRPGEAVPDASGEIAGEPNVLGCSLFGINASVVLHFDPEIALDANGTREMPCQSVASEYCSRARSTRRATAPLLQGQRTWLAAPFAQMRASESRSAACPLWTVGVA